MGGGARHPCKNVYVVVVCCPSGMDPLRNVVALIRVSTEKQASDEKTSIQRQHEDIGIHCRTHSLKVTKEFQFDGLSGANVQRSRRFQDMLREIGRPECAGVVFATLDRFFRPSKLSSYKVFETFENAGKLLFCDIGELDPNSEVDRMKLMIWGQMAGMERTRIADRLVRGKNFKRNLAESATDPLPKGVTFNIETKKFAYVKEVTERVRAAYIRVDKGDSMTHVARDIGFASPTILRFTLQSYWWIGIKASTHRRIGQKWNPELDKMTGGKRVLREVPYLAKTNLAEKPLVSRELWDRVQLKIAERKKTFTHYKTRSNRFLCAGLVRCECGRKMYHRLDTRNGKPSYYRCASNFNNGTPCGRRQFSADLVDREVWVRLLAFTKSRKNLEEQIKANSDTSIDIEAQRKRLEGELAALEKRQRNNAIAVETEGYTPDLAERRKVLSEEIATTKERIAQVDTPSQTISPAAAARVIHERFSASKGLRTEDRKRLLAETVESILVQSDNGEEIAIQFKFKVGIK